MAGQMRDTTDGLATLRALEDEPHRFGFFHAVRLLECLYADRPRLGQSRRPADDPIRLGQEPSLDFAPATLDGFHPGKPGRPWRLTVRFLGLFGPNGPLPLHLTEYARDRLRNEHDPTLVRFLDLFHHRMLSLFFRAWADSEPTVNYDRPEADRFALYVGALFGLGMPSLRDRDAMPDLAKLHYAGRMVCQTRHAEGLQNILLDYFRMPARLEEFVGHWINLPANCLCRLGAAPSTGSLGETTTIGARVWDCQQHFRVVMGPMDFDRYRQLLPGGDSLHRLVAFVRNYAGLELGWDLQLILKREETPPPELNKGCRLGWTTWLHSGTPEQDPDDLILRP